MATGMSALLETMIELSSRNAWLSRSPIPMRQPRGRFGIIRTADRRTDHKLAGVPQGLLC
jgi:hypothetical protein